MKTRLVVSGGGTGGHVYPALAVLEVFLRAKPADSPLPTLRRADLLWVGSQGGMEEELVTRVGLDFVGLAAGGLRGVAPTTAARHAAQIARGVGRARGILSRFQPSAVLVTGGYASVSVALAARSRGIPVLIYLPDIVPGQAIRFLGRFAARIAVTSEESYRFFPRHKAVVTGYPVRPEIFTLTEEQARQALGLDADASTLLVFGGSRGARSINKALVAGLRDLLPVCQVLHVSGRLDADWVAGVAKSLPQELRARYHHYAYLDDMPSALVAADLAVARAGAATLGEFPAAQLPAIMVPYPYSGQHQEPNANYMATHGAAVVLPDAALQQELVSTVLDLLTDEETLAAMRESSRALARPDAAEAIARQLWALAGRRATHPGPQSAAGAEERRAVS